jgi:hypothetical protein
VNGVHAVEALSPSAMLSERKVAPAESSQITAADNTPVPDDRFCQPVS